MVNITVKKGSGDVVITMKGHANSAPHGQDIVCAGVSAVIQTALLGLAEISKNYPDYVNYTEGEL